MKQIIPILAVLSFLCRLPQAASQEVRDIPLTGSPSSNSSQPANAKSGSEQGPPKVNGEEESDADRLVRHASQILPGYQSIDAKIRTRFDLFDHQMNGSGAYQQLGKDGELQLKLELKVALDVERINRFLQVGDGKTLWTYQDQGDRRPVVTQIDLQKIRAAMERKDPWLVTNGAPSLRLGGVPQLVKGLSKSFHFWEAVPGELQGSKIWTLRGGWKSQRLVQLLPDQKATIEKGDPANLRNLPRTVPWGVELVLGQDDFFPYRVSYLRPPVGQEKKLGPQPLADVLVNFAPIVTLEFFELRFNGPVNPQSFVTPVSDTKVVDQTDALMVSLGLQEEKPR